MSETELPGVMSPGTQVVTLIATGDGAGGGARPRGAVGVVSAAPSDELGLYWITFADGGAGAYRRDEIAVRKQVQDAVAQHPALAPHQLREYVIYRCVIGSRAYGLDEPGSDIDRRGFYLPPAELHWSLGEVPEQLEDEAEQECFWEAQKFLTLALKANPNVLECLYTPLIEHATPLAQELVDMREIFLSKMVYQTYNGYVLSQFKRFEQVRRVHGRLKWKHIMHLVRLLLSGVTALSEGYIPVKVEEHRERLLAIRRGEVAWEEIDAWRLQLHRDFDAAFARTRLPERPDFERANAWLLRARRSMVEL
jgi:uncharacterized protein